MSGATTLGVRSESDDKVCAGAFLCHNGSILLGLRSPDRSFYPGVWDAIGGHVRSTESPREAVIRELDEEIQIVPTRLEELAVLDEPRPDVNGKAKYHLFVVTEWTGPGPVICGNEHSALKWFPLAEAVNLDLAHPDYPRLFTTLADRSVTPYHDDRSR